MVPVPVSPDRQSFRLYTFGQLDNPNPGAELTVYGEYGVGRALTRVPIEKAKIDELIARVQELRGYVESNYPPEYSEDTLRKLGSDLFEFLVPGEVKDLLNTAIGATTEGFLPFEIFTEDHRIASWPWEYVSAGEKRGFLCQEICLICRGVFTLRPRKMKSAKGQVRILLLVGVFSSDPEAKPEEEIKWISENFTAHLAENDFNLKVMRTPRPEELHRELLAGQYDIIHFFGHASFDAARKEGFLSFRTGDGGRYPFYANDFARLLAERGIRLVFLNACESARGSPTEDPARSSVAAALLARGVPAVIGSQFSIPDVTAHYLAAMMYNALVTGNRLIDALHEGRLAMTFASKYKFFDWGIPVLYCYDPNLVIFKRSKTKSTAPMLSSRPGAAQSEGILKSLAVEAAGQPSVFVAGGSREMLSDGPRFTVALDDIDSKVGFLPEFARAANKVQSYFRFKVAYSPVPAASFGRNSEGKPILDLNRTEKYLADFPEQLGVDKVCFLTGAMIQHGDLDDLFASSVTSNPNVHVVSTYDMRQYARKAGVSFPKAVLTNVLAMLLATDERWDLRPFHPETVGCLLDYCDNRDDIVESLKHMKFDHQACRGKVTDTKELEAIDTLLAIEFKEEAGLQSG